MLKWFFNASLIAVLALFCISTVVDAQSDFGTINGFVKDQSGAVIPNAKVTLKNEATNIDRVTTTSDSGLYVFTNVPAGYYSIFAEAKGFKKFDITHSKLDPSSTLAVDAAMQVGTATETVEVAASAQALQTESAAVQKLVTREQIDALELNGRNPVGLASLVPGARGGNLAGLSFNFNQGPSNFNGSRNPENLITYDGAPATRTRSNGTSLGAADVDSTSEVQILTSSYAAEYGRTSGAQIRIVTKSGGKDFHGAGYEYVRNTVFNANTWTRNNTQGPAYLQLNSPPPIRYNQYGYNLGGPGYIPGKFNTQKNKIFWYWGQEWVKYRFTDTASWTVPSDAMRRGDFSELLTTNNFLGKSYKIIDPTTGAQFPNNIIPLTSLSRNGTGILKAYPTADLATPINGTNNYYITALHPQDQRKDTLAADFNITDRQRVTFRRNNYAFLEYQPLDGTPTETPKYFNRPNQTNAVDYVWTISPTMINEALATVSLDDVYIPVGKFLDRTTVGLNYPYIFPNGKLLQNRIPTANIANLTGLTGGPYPSHSGGPIYTFTDSLTWVHGKHTFKFGFYYEKSGENDNDEINVSACPTCTNNQNGQFQFNDTRAGGTGNAIANAALGLFDSYSELGQRAYTIFRGSSFEPYVQDSWKVSQKLTVTIGARYTVIVPYHALWGNMIVFDPALYNPSTAVQIDPKTDTILPGGGDKYNGMVIPGANSWPSAAVGRVPEATSGTYDYLHRGGSYPNYFSKIQYGQIQPRLGIAYQLNEKTVIRTGGGEFFTRLGVSDSVFLGGNPPFQPTANVTLGSADNPGGTSANALPLTVTTQSRQFKNPSAWNWNVTVERELPLNSLLSVGYVGRLGLHQQRESDINQPTIAAITPYLDASGNLPSSLPGLLDSLRPYKGYNSIRETDNVARSRYDSLQVAWNRRFTRGLLFGVAYTFSHAYDNGSNQRDIIPDTYYAGNLWGPSEFDVHHVLILNFLYDLPFLRGQHNMVGKTLGGWQVSGIFQAQTGTHCGIGSANDYAKTGLDGSLGCGNAGEFWVKNGNPNIVGNFAPTGNNDPNFYFQTTNSDGSKIFTAPPNGTFNLQQGIRDEISVPGFNNWNMGLFKKFVVHESAQFQFRAEAFDIFNHPNWSGPGLNPTSGNFGKVTGKTGDVRNLQLSLRFQF